MHVQVMALLAYLMQHKGACGPHLIIVPNAVMVNWKSELLRWLPSAPLFSLSILRSVCLGS